MPTAKSTRKPNAALMKPVQPDDTLAKIVGSKPIPRSEVTKKIWDYIKKNKLRPRLVGGEQRQMIHERALRRTQSLTRVDKAARSSVA
jgi:chromatin remodeling complex protein RSC6